MYSKVKISSSYKVIIHRVLDANKFIFQNLTLVGVYSPSILSWLLEIPLERDFLVKLVQNTH
jgi:hypothetical protein